MKSFGIIHVFWLLILLLVYKCADAQDYVITSKGDSVVGQVKPLFYGVDKKVQLLPQGQKKKIIYPIFQVKVFSFKNELYKPVKGPDGYTFMKIVKSGYLSLYNYQLPNQITFDGMYLLKLDGKGMEVPNITFKKAMEKFLSDCQEISEKLNEGELNKKDLFDIIDQYNACIDAKTIDHGKIIAEKEEHDKRISPWDALETKVRGEAEFEGKTNALEMIAEIKNKILKSEKIPNFLVDGLKSSLPQDTFKAELDSALSEIN